MPFTTEASSALAKGRISLLMPECIAHTAIESTPLTCFTSPSRDSSPTNTHSSSILLLTSSVEASIPKAIAISNEEPSFLILAGARFIVILLIGNS